MGKIKLQNNSKIESLEKVDDNTVIATLQGTYARVKLIRIFAGRIDAVIGGLRTGEEGICLGADRPPEKPVRIKITV